MSTHRSYFSKNNTIIYNSLANTGRNPITELFFGDSIDNIFPIGYSRFIFDLNLQPLLEKIADGTITTECSDELTHTLTMTNSIKFNETELNTINSTQRKRANSFDLILFRIPKTSCPVVPPPPPPPITTTTTTLPVTTTTTTLPVTTTTTTIVPVSGTNIFFKSNLVSGNGIYSECIPQPQYWDEGVGFDYWNTNRASNGPIGMAYLDIPFLDKQYSTRPSNWYQNENTDFWCEPGIYNNQNLGLCTNYNDLHIVDIQHFEFGNEDINFDMTDEINGIINGTITDVTGWGIAYRPEFELITGLTANYSVSFFTRHTQTFYEPYLLTTYDDLIKDDRNLFIEKTPNKLYLFAYVDGNLVNLDNNPTVTIVDSDGNPISNLSNLPSCPRTKGVYEVEIPPMIGYKTPCQYNDIWSNIFYNGVQLPDVENDFVLLPYKNRIQIGPQSREPEIFGFDFYGIKQDEKILNTDIRKVGVEIKKAYTTKQLLQNIDASYRVYVREGMTEVQVQDWTQINRTFNEYYFIFDTRDKIPNEYYVDIMVNISGEKDTYKRTLKFMIVNKK